MLCPYCISAIHFSLDPGPKQFVVPGVTPPQSYIFHFGSCPACLKLIVVYTSLITKHIGGIPPEDEFRKAIIYPKSRAMKPIPPEVPQDYAQDFNESRLVVDLSPKSSAALSRRLLQRILHQHFNIIRHNLLQEIQEFVSTLGPPTCLAQQLDAIRLVGNFAAHPMKDTNTDAITDVEEGEAQLLLETVESLFDYSFVQPAKWSASKAAINAKLKAVGKPEIP